MKTSFTLNARSTFAALALAPLLVCVAPVAAESGGGYLSRPEVRTFIEALQAEHGLKLQEVERILGDAQYQAAVVRLLGSTPSQSLPPVRSYPAYRSKFLSEARIAAGVHYWETYDSHLRRAEAEFGVPADVILGILGVETAFGRNTGSFRVVDALATIAFDGLRRQDYFP
jgi:membrane-bound lytic murein transglycosylase B